MKNYKDYVNYRRLPVDVDGISAETAAELEARISEFEEKHLTNAISGGNGWVAKIKTRDIVVSVAVNLIIVFYYIYAILS